MHAALIKIYFWKNQATIKKKTRAKLAKTRLLKIVVHMQQSPKKSSESQKSLSLNTAHEKTSLAQKNLAHTAILLIFTSWSWKIVLPFKKNLKKINTPLRVVK